MPPLVIASDGRQDESAPPSIAILLFDPNTNKKMAVAAVIGQDLMEAWGGSDHCIALVEKAALILGIIRFCATIKGRSLLWFEDNSAVFVWSRQRIQWPPHAGRRGSDHPPAACSARSTSVV